MRHISLHILVALTVLVPTGGTDLGAPARGETYSVADLGTLGGTESGARGISAAGHVVGWAETASGDRHTFLWQDGAMTDLGTLGGPWSHAFGVNDAGEIVGDSHAVSILHAFIWLDGVMTDVGGPPGRPDLPSWPATSCHQPHGR